MRDVARTVQGEARRMNIAPQVEHRLTELGRPSRRSAARWGFVFMGAAACAGAVAFVMMRMQPVTYSVAGAPGVVGNVGNVGNVGRQGNVGDRFVGPDSGELALKFSDGSEVTLPARAEAHVDALDARGATVALEEGTVEVKVVHRDRTRWEVRAGKYQVRVTGTKFAAGWDSRRQTLTVTMHEGSVAVTGPGIKQPMRVVTGQRLRANAAAANSEGQEPAVSIEDAAASETTLAPTPTVEPAREIAPAAPPPVEAQPAAAVPRPAREVRVPARSVHRAPERLAAPQKLARAEAGWRAAASRAQYREALTTAITEGFSEQCQRLGAEDVLLLGDVARLAGDLNRAEEAYQTAGRRFPTADRPAYGLGLVAFRRNDYATAARLFESYVKHSPRGALAQEAAGRLIEARLKAGDKSAAREAASAYLRTYPDGPSAAIARTTLAQ
jgi:ferric-dicitrate binding protein FerR (iron transport regulator)